MRQAPLFPGATSWNKPRHVSRLASLKGLNVIGRMSGAALRGLCVALLIAVPALMLPHVAYDSSQITVLVALLAAMLTFVEYSATSPSILEFRDAPPFNRIRFFALFVVVATISATLKHPVDPSAFTAAVTALGTILGNALDFPFSPVRLAVLMLPETASPALVQSMRIAAGLSYTLSLLAILAFLFAIRFQGWPTRKGAFNVWVNLPLFDPTSGGDVLTRLQRDARVNITIGFLLPFVIPAVVKLASTIIDFGALSNPQPLIWTVAAWAFLPTSMIMRGIAMGKVANLISDKRRRAYASAKVDFQAA